MFPALLLSMLGMAHAADPVPTSLGDLSVASEDASLRLRLASQVQAELTSDDDSTAVRARLRRMRFGLDGSALDGRFTTKLQLNLAPGSSELLDLWGQARVAEGVNLRLGIFKTPFTRYREQSFQRQVLVDWPCAAKAFGSERQLGLAVHDGKVGHDGFGWSLGAFAGPNTRRAFEGAPSAVHAISRANPSDLSGGTARLTLDAPELVGRVTFGTAGMDAASGFDHEGGAPRVLVGISGAADLAPDATVEFAGRAAAEALVKADHVGVTVVSYLGFVPDADDALIAGAVGGTGELTWKATPQVGVALSYSRVDVLPGMTDASKAWAADRIASADPGDVETVTASVASAGAWQGASELGLGGTWFVHGYGLMVQADGAWVRSRARDAAQDSARVRVQTQFVF